MLFFLFLAFFSKSDFEIDGFTYHILSDEDKSVQIVNCSLTTETLIFPSSVTNEGTSYKVISISSDTFSSSNISQFLTIYLPYTITDIENSVFLDFKNLQTIGYINENNEQVNDTLPPLLKKVNNYVFSNCNYVTTLDLNQVTEIGQYSFESSIRITTLKLNVVEVIGPYSLASIQRLQTIELPTTLREIQDFGFAKTSLVNITGEVPNLSIINTGFFFCTELVLIPKLTGIVQIGNEAFQNCYKLREIHCGSKLENIYSVAFNNCKQLETFTCDSRNVFVSPEAFLGCSNLKHFDFNCAIEILNNAFEECTSLDVVDMSESQMDHLNPIFQSCSLSSIILPPNLSEIDSDSFYECNVKSITFSGTLGTLDLTRAFYNFAGELYEVAFAPSCSVDFNNAFVGCSHLSKVVLPRTSFILDQTFVLCTNLSTVENVGYCTLLNYTFNHCYKLAAIDSFESAEVLGIQVFSNCRSLTSLPSFSKIESIGFECFVNCDKLEYFECGDKLNEVGKSAFKGCSSLETFTTKSKNYSINSEAFSNCKGLKKFNFLNCYSINTMAFQFCESLSAVDMSGATFTVISAAAFQGCIALEKVTFPHELQTIETLCFSECVSLKYVYFETNYNYLSIYTEAFKGCSNLETVTFKIHPFMIFNHAFLNCTSLHSVTVEQSTAMSASAPVHIIDGAFENCTSLTVFEFDKWPISEIGKFAFYNCPLSSTIKFSQAGKVASELNISSFAFASPVVHSVDFRFDYTSLKLDKDSFSACKNINCVMIDKKNREDVADFFRGKIINGIHCPNYIKSHLVFLILVVAGAAVLLIALVVAVACLVRRRRQKMNQTQPLLTTEVNQYK